MKHSARTYSAVWAVLLILLLAVCPHHHHEGGAACWAVEVCHSDGRANDVHTHHKDKEAHHAMLAKVAKHYASPSQGDGNPPLWTVLPLIFGTRMFPSFVLPRLASRQSAPFRCAAVRAALCGGADRPCGCSVFVAKAFGLGNGLHQLHPHTPHETPYYYRHGRRGGCADECVPQKQRRPRRRIRPRCAH